MNSALTQEFWEAAGRRRLADMAGFPFAGHSALRDAVASGQASLGIEFAAARDTAHFTRSYGAYYFILGLMWVPLLLSFLSVGRAIQVGRWGPLGGLITAIVGFVWAGAALAIRAIARANTIAIAVAAILTLSQGTPNTTLGWAAGCFILSSLAPRFASRIAWSWAHRAVLESEEYATWLFATRNLHIRDAQGRIHDFQAPAAGSSRRTTHFT